MAQREFLMLLKESSFVTPNLTTGAPTAGQFIYIRLDGDNNFTMRPNLMTETIQHGGGVNIPALRKGDRVECRGRLSVLLSAAQASFLLPWAITRINSGRTTPWTTTDAGSVMPPGDLASVSVYHAIQRWDGTIKRRRYGGTKVTGYELTGSEDQRIWRLSLDLEAAKPFGNTDFGDSDADPTSTEFPAPADTVYPSDLYLWGHSGLTIGTARTRVTSITVRGQNRMDPHTFFSKYLQINYFTGRETTVQANHLLLASPDDRAAFEAQTAKTTSVVLDNGTVETTLTLNTANQLSAVDDDLALGRAYSQGLTIANLYDTSVGGDQPDISCSFA